MEKTVAFCGRVPTASELNLVRQIVANFPRLSQAEWLQKWQPPNGLRALPELPVTKPRGAHCFHAGPPADPQPSVRGRLADSPPLRLPLIAKDILLCPLESHGRQRVCPLPAPPPDHALIGEVP